MYNNRYATRIIAWLRVYWCARSTAAEPADWTAGTLLVLTAAAAAVFVPNICQRQVKNHFVRKCKDGLDLNIKNQTVSIFPDIVVSYNIHDKHDRRMLYDNKLSSQGNRFLSFPPPSIPPPLPASLPPPSSPNSCMASTRSSSSPRELKSTSSATSA